MSAHVIATAGHVDHGKSTLVAAITGMDPDRLEEEKARGLTIDLGFAWVALPSARQIAFVDVPGHVRFLKNMLAGVGAVDACLFVVAATEGWKPQSEEHLRILELLGIERGVVALTKVASLAKSERQHARTALEEHLAGSFLAPAPVVEVDAPGGLGLAELIAELDVLTASIASDPSPSGESRPRLWIDRSFPIRGSGTVVTGTLAGGPISLNDKLAVLPSLSPDRRPVEVRVRGLQTQLQARATVERGRVAVNISGLSHSEVERGQALVRPEQWEPTTILDASVDVLANLDHEVGRRGAYRAYFGSGQHAVRLRLLHRDGLLPGESGLVRIYLPLPLPLRPGDRYVLREVGRSETVGGGEVLDVAPVLPAAKAQPDRSVDRVIAERGFVDAELLNRLTGERRRADLEDRWVCDPARRAEAEERLLSSVKDAGPYGLDVAALSPIDRALLGSLDGVVVRDGRGQLVGSSRSGALHSHPYVALLEASLFRPPSPQEAGVDRNELRELVRSGAVVESGGCYFAARAMTVAAREIARLLIENPAGVSASTVRETLGSTRKYILPLLAHLDTTGMTRRRGDMRVAGPRLSQPDPRTTWKQHRET